MAEVMLVTWWIWSCPHCPDLVYKHPDREIVRYSASRHHDRTHGKTLLTNDFLPMRTVWAFNIRPEVTSIGTVKES